MAVGGWRVHRYDFDRSVRELPSALSGRGKAALPDLVRGVGGRDGGRFLLAPNGFPDLRVNSFLSSARMRTLSDNTNRDYTYSLALWLNFLESRNEQWWTASTEDAEEFEFWRLTDPANTSIVGTSTFAKDVAACKKFYRWAASRYPDVHDVFGEVSFPRAKRDAGVKWLDPKAIDRWRDIGLQGRDLNGRPDPNWRGRNDQRDSAFADGLFGTGLRLTEWGSVVLPELPRVEPGRAFYTCSLSDACAKGGYGHAYWMPRAVLQAVRAYIEGPRARAVRQAQEVGRYESVKGRQLAKDDKRAGQTLLLTDNGEAKRRSWNLIPPSVRRKMFVQKRNGLEPLALWLNEDGLPRDPHGWHHTFESANSRIEALGLPNFRCTPHMHRHSFALKWFAIGKLVHSSKLSHLGDDEAQDFRTQFGDTWHLVQTMLGHASVETTKNVYLEPFRSLDVEVLLNHANDFPVADFLSQAFQQHPNVVSDPLGRTR